MPRARAAWISGAVVVGGLLLTTAVLWASFGVAALEHITLSGLPLAVLAISLIFIRNPFTVLGGAVAYLVPQLVACLGLFMGGSSGLGLAMAFAYGPIVGLVLLPIGMVLGHGFGQRLITHASLEHMGKSNAS